jgi:hypothetical protein
VLFVEQDAELVQLPIGAVRDPARFLEGPRTLTGSCLVRCQDCGTPIAPAPMLDAIARRMASRRGAPGVVGEISRLCPDCRLAVPVGGA